MTSPASVRGFNLKNHEELKKNSQLIEKWHRFSLGVCEKSHTPGTDRVNEGMQGASEVGLQSYASCIKVISIGFRVALFKENTVALLEKQ